MTSAADYRTSAELRTKRALAKKATDVAHERATSQAAAATRLTRRPSTEWRPIVSGALGESVGGVSQHARAATKTRELAKQHAARSRELVRLDAAIEAQAHWEATHAFQLNFGVPPPGFQWADHVGNHVDAAHDELRVRLLRDELDGSRGAAADEIRPPPSVARQPAWGPPPTRCDLAELHARRVKAAKRVAALSLELENKKSEIDLLQRNNSAFIKQLLKPLLGDALAPSGAERAIAEGGALAAQHRRVARLVAALDDAISDEVAKEKPRAARRRVRWEAAHTPASIAVDYLSVAAVVALALPVLRELVRFIVA